jgi:hypothetical protein
MQESSKITTNLGETLLAMMRQAVREEIRTLIRDMCEKDRLLTAQEGADMLGLSGTLIPSSILGGRARLILLNNFTNDR